MARALAFIDFSDVPTEALLVRGSSIRGNPVPKMVRELKRVKPALIIMGTHQHGRMFEALFGSASSKVIHKAACPILLIPTQSPPAQRRGRGGTIRPLLR